MYYFFFKKAMIWTLERNTPPSPPCPPAPTQPSILFLCRAASAWNPCHPYTCLCLLQADALWGSCHFHQETFSSSVHLVFTSVRTHLQLVTYKSASPIRQQAPWGQTPDFHFLPYTQIVCSINVCWTDWIFCSWSCSESPGWGFCFVIPERSSDLCIATGSGWRWSPCTGRSVLATGPPGKFPELGLECHAKKLEIYPKENMGSLKISTPCMWLMSLLPSCHPMCWDEGHGARNKMKETHIPPFPETVIKSIPPHLLLLHPERFPKVSLMVCPQALLQNTRGQWKLVVILKTPFLTYWILQFS